MSEQLHARPLIVDMEAGEAEWDYALGRVVRGYGYNARGPGPVIEARQGQTLLVRLRIDLGGRRSLRRGVDFFINDDMRHHAEAVGAGELQIWDIVDETKMDHRFHLHGFFFQLLQVNSSPPRHLSWEDTLNVPDRGWVRIASLPDDRPGGWMYHCHILEHHAAGMMASFEVPPRLGSVSSHHVPVPGGHHEQIH